MRLNQISWLVTPNLYERCSLDWVFLHLFDYIIVIMISPLAISKSAPVRFVLSTQIFSKVLPLGGISLSKKVGEPNPTLHLQLCAKEF